MSCRANTPACFSSPACACSAPQQKPAGSRTTRAPCPASTCSVARFTWPKSPDITHPSSSATIPPFASPLGPRPGRTRARSSRLLHAPPRPGDVAASIAMAKRRRPAVTPRRPARARSHGSRVARSRRNSVQHRFCSQRLVNIRRRPSRAVRSTRPPAARRASRARSRSMP